MTAEDYTSKATLAVSEKPFKPSTHDGEFEKDPYEEARGVIAKTLNFLLGEKDGKGPINAEHVPDLSSGMKRL